MTMLPTDREFKGLWMTDNRKPISSVNRHLGHPLRLGGAKMNPQTGKPCRKRGKSSPAKPSMKIRK